jgi:hypothetical protein
MNACQFNSHSGRHRRQPRRHLRVLIQGAELQNRNATDAFLAALRQMGLERVAALDIKLCGRPLVSRSEPPPDRTYYRSGDWFVITHCSTREKKCLLEQVAEELGIDIRVSVIEPTDQEQRQSGSSGRGCP